MRKFHILKAISMSTKIQTSVICTEFVFNSFKSGTFLHQFVSRFNKKNI